MGKKIVILVILFSVLLLSACGIKVDGIPNQKHRNLIAGDFYVAILDGSGNLQIGYMANCEYEKERRKTPEPRKRTAGRNIKTKDKNSAVFFRWRFRRGVRGKRSGPTPLRRQTPGD